MLFSLWDFPPLLPADWALLLLQLLFVLWLSRLLLPPSKPKDAASQEFALRPQQKNRVALRRHGQGPPLAVDWELQGQPDAASSGRRCMLLFTPTVAGCWFARPRPLACRKVMSEPELLLPGPEEPAGPSPSTAFLGGCSLAELQQIPAELRLTRRRIEAGVRDQQRQRQLLSQVQDRLAQCRLRGAAQQQQLGDHLGMVGSPRARSQSPVAEPGPTLPRRPSTAHWGERTAERRVTEGSSRENEEDWEGGRGRQRQQQFGLRLSLLEQQLEWLSAMTSQAVGARLTRLGDQRRGPQQTLAAERTQSPPSLASGARQIGVQLGRMRAKLDQLREETRETLSREGEELEQRLRALGRRLGRRVGQQQDSARQQGGGTAAELCRLRAAWERTRVENEQLLAARAESARQVERADNRCGQLERTIAQLWTLPALARERTTAVAIDQRAEEEVEEDKSSELIAAIRTAIGEASETERSKWLDELETERQRANEEMEREKERGREEADKARRESRMEWGRREKEWGAEVGRLRRELEGKRVELEGKELEAERAREEAAQQRRRLEQKQTELEAERSAAKQRAEADKAQRESLEKERDRLETELAESNREKDALRMELNAGQQEQRRLGRRVEEQSRANEKLAEEFRQNSARLAQSESRVSVLLSKTQELDRSKREGVQMADRLAQLETELEDARARLEGTEQRLTLEREMRLSEADRADRDWEEQTKLVQQAETQREELAREVAEAERRHKETVLAEKERTKEKWAELGRLKAEWAEEKAVRAEEEARQQTELARLGAQLAGTEAEAEELREREADWAERQADAEHKLAKAAELYRKLNAELDELSERSITQSNSAEKLRVELEDSQGELTLLRTQAEEQRRRGGRLEAELRQKEKELAGHRERVQRLEAELTRDETDRELERRRERWASELLTLAQRWERRLGLAAADGDADSGGEAVIPRLDRLLARLHAQLERTILETSNARQEREILGTQLASARQMLLGQQSEMTAREAECQRMRARLAKTELQKGESEARKKEQLGLAEREWAEQRRTMERRTEELEQLLARERTERDREREKSSAEWTERFQLETQRLAVELAEVRAQLEERDRQLAAIRQRQGRGTDSAESNREKERTKTTAAELADKERRLSTAMQRMKLVQERLERTRTERDEAQSRADQTDRRETERRAEECALRTELNDIRLQWRKAVQEGETARRALREADTIRRELESQLHRAQRERNAHKQHAEALELDRRRVEAVIRQTTQERNALDKSLGVMERENGELQRHCGTLQAQVEKLAREGEERGQRRRVGQLENELARLAQEKRKLEKQIVQRESSQETRVSLLESRLDQTRAQLEAERQRRRQSWAEPWK